jgi:hypothetical protein
MCTTLRLIWNTHLLQFVAHPNVQQLLTAIWYDGLPGFKRLSQVQQLLQVIMHII